MKIVRIKSAQGCGYYVPLDQNPLLGAHDVKTVGGTLRCAFGIWIPDCLLYNVMRLVETCDSKYVTQANAELFRMVSADATYDVDALGDHFTPEYEAYEQTLVEFISLVDELVFK